MTSAATSMASVVSEGLGRAWQGLGRARQGSVGSVGGWEGRQRPHESRQPPDLDLEVARPAEHKKVATKLEMTEDMPDG